MNRETALSLVKEHVKAENLIAHCLAVEACMRAFAEKFGEDIEKWGLAGLLHDLDYQYTANEPDRHTLMTEEMLADYNLDPSICHAIKAHNNKAELDSLMNKTLYAVDPVSGFITACALMHPSKQLVNVDLTRMKKRFKTVTFAKGASREQMETCVTMGVTLDDFLVISLTAMQGIAPQLGL